MEQDFFLVLPNTRTQAATKFTVFFESKLGNLLGMVFSWQKQIH